MWSKLQSFRTIINKLHDHQDSFNSTKNIWNRRLNELEQILSPLRPRARVRRGLFDFIGDISNKNFGTATEEEVRDCKRQIRMIRGTNQKIVHVVKNLITVVNQTYDELKANRQHILDIENYITKVATEMGAMEAHLATQIDQLVMLRLEAQIDRTLSELEVIYHNWERQIDLYKRQRASLEMGRLTEEILPNPELDLILKAGRRAGFHAAPIQWYYEHLRIQPMWEIPRELVFRVEIPFTDGVIYLRYQIWTWSVPGNMSEFRTRVKVPADVAYDTNTGGLFVPTGCIGYHPMICRTGAIYDREKFKCPRGILSGEKELRQYCHVNIVKNPGDVLSIQELTPGTFAILTSGEYCAVYCSGQPNTKIDLTNGLHVVQLRTGCQMKGRGWLISSIITRNSEVSIKLRVVKVPPLIISDMLPEHVVAQHFELPKWKALNVINDVAINDLMTSLEDNENVNFTWGSHAGHFSWVTFLIVIMILLVLGIIMYFLFKRQIIKCPMNFFKKGRRTKYTLSPKERKSELGNIELNALTPSAGNEVTVDSEDSSNKGVENQSTFNWPPTKPAIFEMK